MNWPQTHVLTGLLDCQLAGSELADIYRYLDESTKWITWGGYRDGDGRKDKAAQLRQRLWEIIGANRSQLIEKGLI